MALLEVVQTTRTRHEDPPTSPAQVAELNKVRSAEQSFIDTLRAEIDDYFVTLKLLNNLPTEEVFATLSAITARLAELRGQLWRSESRRCAALRSREVEPLLEICDRLFKIHSRIVAVNTLDWDAARGQV